MSKQSDIAETSLLVKDFAKMDKKFCQDGSKSYL